MKTSFIKRIAGITAFLMLATQISLPVYATAGACSNHGGVNCAAGADSDGSVICNDGTTDSSVDYADMKDECGADFVSTGTVNTIDDTTTDPTGATTNDNEGTDSTETTENVSGAGQAEDVPTEEITTFDSPGDDTITNKEPVELSTDVSVTNVVDVISDDTEDVSNTTGEALVNEAVEEIMEEIENMDEEEAADAIEEIEEDIQEEIDDLVQEGNENTGKREKNLKRIRYLKDLLIKLRAKTIKKHKEIVNIIRKVKNYPAVYEMRWGDLSGTRHCSGEKVADIIKDLAAGEVPCDIEAIEYDGTIAVDTGTLKIRKKILFEDKYDEIIQEEGDSISFNSNIAGHWDGLIVEFIPDNNDDGTKPEVNVKISLGTLNKTFPGSEVEGRFDIGNGHILEVKHITKILSGISNVNQDKLIETKVKIQEKISNVQEKLYRLHMLNKGGNKIDELENIIDEAGEYNFDETSSTELQNEINEIVTELRDNVSDAGITTLIQRLKIKLQEIKAKAKSRKFVKGMIPFKDTDDDSWYTKYVAPVKERGIISGYKDTTGNELGEYRPANNITVAEILKIALETAGEGESSETPDLASALNHWAKGYVAKAEKLGLDIVSDDIDLNRLATRGEVIRIMLEALDITPDVIEKSDFFDVLTSHEHADFIQYAKDLGIISGDADTNNFRPDDPINRAEAAKIADLMFSIVLGGNEAIGGDEPWE